LSIRIGLGWTKSHSFTTGQCPVMKYHHGLVQMILNAIVISCDEAPQATKNLDAGVAQKFVLNPDRLTKA
jgi:glutathione-independent formaldehyde dehydrogenase